MASRRELRDFWFDAETHEPVDIDELDDGPVRLVVVRHYSLEEAKLSLTGASSGA